MFYMFYRDVGGYDASFRNVNLVDISAEELASSVHIVVSHPKRAVLTEFERTVLRDCTFGLATFVPNRGRLWTVLFVNSCASHTENKVSRFGWTLVEVEL